MPEKKKRRFSQACWHAYRADQGVGQEIVGQENETTELDSRPESKSQVLTPTPPLSESKPESKPADITRIRRRFEQWIDKNRKYWWIPMTGLLVLGLIAGILLGRGTAPTPTPISDHIPDTPIFTLSPISTNTQVSPTSTITISPTDTVAANTSTNTPEPIVPVLFNEDFEGTDISPIWANPMEGDKPTISGGALQFQSKTKYLIGDSTWKNYTVSISTLGLRCNPGQGFSLTIGVRYQEDTAEMIAFRWFDYHENCQPFWLKGQDELWKPLGKNLFALPETENGNKWTNIIIKADGNTFTTSYGGQTTILDAWPTGQVVIIGYQTMAIDNIGIVALP